MRICAAGWPHGLCRGGFPLQVALGPQVSVAALGPGLCQGDMLPHMTFRPCLKAGNRPRERMGSKPARLSRVMSLHFGEAPQACPAEWHW